MTHGAPYVLGLVEQAVAASPRDVAVRAPDGVLTYEELWDRSERLARALRADGVGPGDLVGQCVERSAALVVATVAILRAGAAFVAIDPAYPDERVRWMLDDSRANAVVTDARTARRADAFGDQRVVVLADGGELQAPGSHDSNDPLPGAAEPDDLAYVVYTSGSTGRPKGAMVEHAGLANLVAWHREAFALRATDRCTQIASPGFDAAVWEIWPALASGAAIHVAPDSLRRDPIELRDWLVAEGVTVSFLPTAVAEGVIGLAWPDDAPLRQLLTGGDALSRRPRAHLPFTVVNNYGLSETAVVATSGPVAADGNGVPSIGRAIAGVVTEVVDAELRPVEAGAEGELLIGGVALARGYLGRDDLTAERFVETERGRRFRTGDLVRTRADGEIEFLGRIDDQLSIRGFRVEPGEIAAALNAHPQVEASVAIGAGSSSADSQLVAYVVGADGRPPDPVELVEFISGFLPEYMVPSRYLFLDALPVTAHGKIDRDALPAFGDPGGDTPAAGRLPETDIESATAAIVAELLELDEIGMDQNFFLVGGHSLLGAQLIGRLGERFGVEISLRFLFDHPTPAAIVAEVERQLAEDEVADEAAGLVAR